jgi:plastocyanin
VIWRVALVLFASIAGSGSPPRTHTVEIRGMEFHPAAITVSVGDTIVWVNRDIVPHTSTTGDWDTGLLTQGQSGRVVARHAGSLRYVCRWHPTMRGTLVTR